MPYPVVPTPFTDTSYDEFATAVDALTPSTVQADDVTTSGNYQPDLDQRGNVYSGDAQLQSNGQITTDYSSEIVYIRDEGVRVYPVAGTDATGGQSGRLVQECCPVEGAIITWTAISTGGPPRIPSPT